MDKQSTKTQLLEQQFVIEGYRGLTDQQEVYIAKLENDLTVSEASKEVQ